MFPFFLASRVNATYRYSIQSDSLQTGIVRDTTVINSIQSLVRH